MKTEPIICGIDFSPTSEKAARVAAALARRVSAPLLLLHSRDSLPAELPVVTEQLIVTAYQEKMEKEVARLPKDIVIEQELAMGAADVSLTSLARQRSAQMIVVSSLGLRAPARWLLGSVAERTAESSPVPTLVVRDAEPLEAWLRGERPLKIFIAVDFTATSDTALRWVTGLLALGACEITAAYVDSPLEEAARLGCKSGLSPTGGNTSEAQALLERDLLAKVTGLLGKDDVAVRVVGNMGRPDLPLVALAVEAGADLMVIGTHQRRGLQRLWHSSVSRHILHHAPMNVCCVPPTAVAPAGRVECKRVLVAVDLNEAHSFAIPHAYSIANEGGTVRLIYNMIPSRCDENAVAEAEAKLRALAPLDATQRGLTNEVEVTVSWETAETICAAAERFGADVICIGTHTRPGLTARVLGSIALLLLQQSNRPVLVVRPVAE